MKLDSQRETVNLPDTSDNYSKEITVRVEGDSGPLLVIPIHVSLDVDTLNTGYLDVKIEVLQQVFLSCFSFNILCFYSMVICSTLSIPLI